MATTRKPTSDEPGQQEPRGDVFKVMVYAPSRKAIAELLRSSPLDVGPMRVPRGKEEVELMIFASEKEIAQLRNEGWNLEVREDMSEVGRSRQKEVGKGDRFEGGKIPPKGLGKKTGKEK